MAALSDSFLPLLVTVTRSDSLDQMTRPGQHGGNEMVTEELTKARIMFGELVVSEPASEGGVPRMGFGLEAEIKAPRAKVSAKSQVDRSHLDTSTVH